jgi:integral membrane protein
MNNSSKTNNIFKAIAYAEGISFLLLLGIAMPLKYMAGIPEPVKYLGWAHGVLFILYMVALVQVFFTQRLSILKLGIGVIAAFLPFGPFLFHINLK